MLNGVIKVKKVLKWTKRALVLLAAGLAVTVLINLVFYILMTQFDITIDPDIRRHIVTGASVLVGIYVGLEYGFKDAREEILKKYK